MEAQSAETDKPAFGPKYPFDVLIKFLQECNEIESQALVKAKRKIRALERKLDRKYGVKENWRERQ